MRQDAVLMFLTDSNVYPTLATQKAAVYRQAKKLKFRKSKVCQTLQTEFEPLTKKSCQSADQSGSISIQGPAIAESSSDDSSNIDDNLSLCADGQTPSEQLLEGTVKFFEKDIPFVVQSGKVFLHIQNIDVIKKHVDNRGYALMKIVLEKKGMDFNSSFLLKSSANSHMSVDALLLMLTNYKIGMDKNMKKEQLSTELYLVLEMIAVSNMKPKEASTERKQTNLPSFLANTYRNLSEKFAKDLSKLIGKSKEGFSLDKEDLVTVLTTNLTNTTNNKLVTLSSHAIALCIPFLPNRPFIWPIISKAIAS